MSRVSVQKYPMFKTLEAWVLSEIWTTHRVAIGNEPLMEQCDVDLSSHIENIQRAAAKGVTISFVAKRPSVVRMD